MDTGEVNVVSSRREQSSRQATQISIVTPSRNQGRYLDETIASVLGQAGDFLLDYIVVDGASTDDSVDVLRRYERQLQSADCPVRCRGIRFRWLSEPDRGQSEALAKGLRMATGELLGWLNSDDTYLPGALTTACSVFSSVPDCSVVYGKANYIDESGKYLGQYPTEPFSDERLVVVNFIAQPSVFFRRKTLEQVEGPNTDLHYVMDYDLWLRMSKVGIFRYVESSLSNYRLHAESKTIAPKHALENARECLQVVRQHAHWAPANRVYEFCSQWLRANLSSPTLNRQPATAILTLPIALAKYLAMNRGIRLADVRQLTPANVKRLFGKQRLY